MRYLAERPGLTDSNEMALQDEAPEHVNPSVAEPESSMKSYLVLEKGVIEERLFLLGDRLTIGRMLSNDVCPSDATVSRRHAVVYLDQGEAFVEDLGSLNGTFVNGNRVQKSPLASGDALRFGDVIFRFVQEGLEADYAHLTETQEISQSEITVSSGESGPRGKAQRLIESIAYIPIFSNLEQDDLINISTDAHLLVFDRGRTIIQEGESSKSLYIIFEGSVRMLTYDQQGEEIELERLSEGQIFGEISFLPDTPMNVTVQAVEETLLCQVHFDCMREIFDRRPALQAQFEVHCRARQEDLEARKREEGATEPQSHHRSDANLPVSFTVSSSQGAAGRFKKKVFRSFSQDVSISSIRIRVQDQSLFGLPPRCLIRLEVSLPHPWGTIKCSGAVISKERQKEGKNLGYMNVKFTSLPRVQRDRLQAFLMRE